MDNSDFSGEQQAFRDAYEDTLTFLEARQAIKPLSVIDLEGELHHLTVYEGQDWGGRGPLKNAEIQGQISAYITVIDAMKGNN
ncbi:MAG: hypothetical protein RBS49_06635 [Sphaerochaeta sp.]|jgi:hypothetical protein|nr:hypothetical protein [Sphaerochaeta sp.]MDX9915553.1 hypothetical protein [Sphaerochaeta sp.]